MRSEYVTILNKIKEVGLIEENQNTYVKLYLVKGNEPNIKLYSIEIDSFDGSYVLLNQAILKIKSFMGIKKEDTNQLTLDLGEEVFNEEMCRQYDFVVDKSFLYVLSPKRAEFIGISNDTLNTMRTVSDTVMWSNLNLESGDKILFKFEVNECEYELLMGTSGSMTMGQKTFLTFKTNKAEIHDTSAVVNFDPNNIIYVKNVTDNWILCKNLDRFRTHFNLTEKYEEKAYELLSNICDYEDISIGVDETLLVLREKGRYTPDFILEYEKEIDEYFSENEYTPNLVNGKYKVNSEEELSKFIKLHSDNPRINPYTHEKVS